MRAVEFLHRANQIQPNRFDILFKLGTALYHTKKLDEAKGIFEPLNTASPTAETNYYLGLIVFDQNQFETAKQYFENSLTLKPNFADANFMLGEISAKQKKYAEAVNFYQKAISQDKSKDVYFVRLGGVYLIQSQFNQALPYFKEAAELFPKIAEIKYFLAVTLRGLGNYDLAITEIKKSLAIKETADANALLGAILADRNEFTEAEKSLRKAVSLNPNHFNSHHDLGRILVKQQKPAEALPILQKAASLMPKNADVHYQLFLTYSRLKRKAEADKELEIFKQLSQK
jgi:tetratricopeptide (TPR) repeat protein